MVLDQFFTPPCLSFKNIILILEVIARGKMIVGEVLKLRATEVHDRKMTLRAPKSGKEMMLLHQFLKSLLFD